MKTTICDRCGKKEASEAVIYWGGAPLVLNFRKPGLDLCWNCIGQLATEWMPIQKPEVETKEPAETPTSGKSALEDIASTEWEGVDRWNG